MRFPLLSVAAAAALLAGVSQVHAATYTLDPDHTFVTFEIGHFGTSTNRGRFDKKEGTVQFDRAGKTGKVDIVFHTASTQHRHRSLQPRTCKAPTCWIQPNFPPPDLWRTSSISAATK